MVRPSERRLTKSPSSGRSKRGSSNANKPLPKDHFLVARCSQGLYVRVHGFGNMHNAPTFKEFAERMVEEGYTNLILDLKQCRGLDSTFMGMLLGVNSAVNAKKSAQDGGLVLIQITDHCRKQLSSIGLDTFLTFHEGSVAVPQGDLRAVEGREVSADERLALIVRAHKDLIAVDARNEEKFGPFLRAILKDI